MSSEEPPGSYVVRCWGVAAQHGLRTWTSCAEYLEYLLHRDSAGRFLPSRRQRALPGRLSSDCLCRRTARSTCTRASSAHGVARAVAWLILSAFFFSAELGSCTMHVMDRPPAQPWRSPSALACTVPAPGFRLVCSSRQRNASARLHPQWDLPQCSQNSSCLGCCRFCPAKLHLAWFFFGLLCGVCVLHRTALSAGQAPVHRNAGRLGWPVAAAGTALPVHPADRCGCAARVVRSERPRYPTRGPTEKPARKPAGFCATDALLPHEWAACIAEAMDLSGVYSGISEACSA